jgi:cell division topological specificity factor
MKEIFTDLYKKVLGFFQTQEKITHDESKNVAVNRMKLVLMQDRTNLTPYLLEKMRGEMIDVLAKYVEMDKEALELNFEQEGDQMALMLSIPVIRAKDEDEIKAALAEETGNGEQETDEAKCKEQSAKCHCEEVCLQDDEAIQKDFDSDEETDEDIEENDEEEVCSCVCEECEECSESPDEIEEEIEEETSEKKSKKKK